MILSTQTRHLANRFDDFTALGLLAEAGFDALDYSMMDHMKDPDHPICQAGYRDHAHRLKKEAKRLGLFFNQAHGPYPTYVEGRPDYNARIQPLVDRSIELAALLGARVVVIHPIDAADEARKQALNRQQYQRTQKLAAHYGIQIGLENMWDFDKKKKRFVANVCSTADSFIAMLDQLDPRYFTACLDLGHCGLVGQDAAAMIRALGHDRLTALHVHDNDFRDDRHTAPYLGRMDWQAISQALADIRYQGDLTLEADGFLSGFPDALIPQAAHFLQAIGRQLIDQIQRAMA